MIYEKSSDRWEYCVCSSDTDKFEQVSFVNGICTSKGGVHVDVIVKLLNSGISKYIKKKYKKDILEKYIKNHLCIYLNCVIEDPSFSSQIKDTLITPKSKFGSKPEISDKFIKDLCDSGLSEKILQFSEFKEKSLAKKTNGVKKNKIRDIPKLDDANWAGGPKSDQCTLILTEGDSAKALAISGLSKFLSSPLTFKILPFKGNTPYLSLPIILKPEIANALAESPSVKIKVH
jgi:DNA topoisomerase-2